MHFTKLTILMFSLKLRKQSIREHKGKECLFTLSTRPHMLEKSRTFTGFHPGLTNMLKRISLAVTAAAAGALVIGMPSYAQVDYTQDSTTDGEGRVSNGVSAFELFGTGYVQEGNHLIVGISSKLSLGGEAFNNVLNDTVAWGDMFFNFSPDDDFNTALGNGDVYGVRFAEGNDSSVDVGLYKVDATKTVSGQNRGFNSLQAYRNAASDATLGDVFDLEDGSVLNNGTNYNNFTYLPKTGANRSSTQSLIHEGVKLGDVDVLDETQLSNYGFDFANNITREDVPNAKTYGFKFDVSNLPGGSFIAHLWAECFNEGTAFKGEVASVPEPTSALALAVVGAVAWTRKRKAHKA